MLKGSLCDPSVKQALPTPTQNVMSESTILCWNVTWWLGRYPEWLSLKFLVHFSEAEGSINLPQTMHTVNSCRDDSVASDQDLYRPIVTWIPVMRGINYGRKQIRGCTRYQWLIRGCTVWLSQNFKGLSRVLVLQSKEITFLVIRIEAVNVWF